ncbi:MAG: deoxyribodipyrimidine photo-lyase [Bacteroidota bacterium]
MSGKTIILWCREPSFCRGISPSPFGDAVSLVPLFCFDPREHSCFADATQFDKYHKILTTNVAELRQDLLSRGSNLLVVNGQYEKMIPSIARVLGASDVVTFNDLEPPAGISGPLHSFKLDSVHQVSFNLGMHSIGFSMFDLPSDANLSNPLFPPFPRINPGRIPTAA